MNTDAVEIAVIHHGLGSSLVTPRLSDIARRETMERKRKQQLQIHDRMAYWCNDIITKIGVTLGAVVTIQIDS
jgi:hypothetical protein